MEQALEIIKKYLLQLYAKLKDLYLSMTLGNRIVATLLMATLLCSLGYLIVGSIKPADPSSKVVKLYNGYRFEPNDLRAAENAIAKKGLTGHQWLGDQLQVPKDKESAYVAILAENNIPSKSGLSRLDTVLSLGPWQNAKLMDQKMMTAKEMDTANAIKMIPGIAEAKVFTNKRPAWEKNVWARTQITSVGVYIESIENKPLSADAIAAIGGIIMPAFGITNFKEIRIVDTKHQRSYDGSGEEVSATQSEYLRHQKKYQKEWSDRIYEFFPPIEGLKVETNVVLTTYREQKMFDVEHRKPTALTTHVLGYDFMREGFDRFFRPGQIAQFGSPLIDPTGQYSPRDRTTEKKHEAEQSNALPGTETQTESLPYIPKEVTASIQIPRDHIVATWREKNRLYGAPNTQPTKEELQAEEEEFALTTKQGLAKLLESYRVSTKTDPMELISVVYYDRLLPEEVVLTAWEQFVQFLKENWQNLSLMSLVFSGLLVLWLISKPPRPEPIVIYEGLETPLEALDARIAEKIRREEEARRLAEEEAAAEAEQIEFENSLGELGSIRSLREEIAELIRQNPEAAAAIIRQWIGNAAMVEAKT
jgi:flagellar M-ring protein FliF